MIYLTHMSMAAALSMPVGKIIAEYATQHGYNFNIFVFFAFSIIGSLLPDIDQEGSFIHRLLAPFSYIFSSIFEHRGFTHNINGIICFSIFTAIVAYYLKIEIGMGLLFGYVAHILGDAMTISGIRKFCCSKNLFLLPRIFRFKTGSMKEYIFLLLFASVFFYYMTSMRFNVF